MNFHITADAGKALIQNKSSLCFPLFRDIRVTIFWIKITGCMAKRGLIGSKIMDKGLVVLKMNFKRVENDLKRSKGSKISRIV